MCYQVVAACPYGRVGAWPYGRHVLPCVGLGVTGAGAGVSGDVLDVLVC